MRFIIAVKVPAYIAESWTKMIHDSMNGKSSRDSSVAGCTTLGCISLDADQQQHLVLSKEASDGERLPKRYKLHEHGDVMPQSYIISRDGANHSVFLTSSPESSVTISRNYINCLLDTFILEQCFFVRNMICFGGSDISAAFYSVLASSYDTYLGLALGPVISFSKSR